MTGFTIWDLNEQIIEQYHDVRNHLYSVAVGSMARLGSTELEKLENLAKSLFVRSHVWSLRKRFSNFTDLLV